MQKKTLFCIGEIDEVEIQAPYRTDEKVQLFYDPDGGQYGTHYCSVGLQYNFHILIWLNATKNKLIFVRVNMFCCRDTGRTVMEVLLWQ